MAYKNYTLSDFANSFGCSEKDFSKSLKSFIAKHDFSYEIITGKNLNNLILEILISIDNDRQLVGSESRRDVWEKGWEENLNLYVNNKFKDEDLIPKFIRNNKPIRLFKKLVQPNDTHFELNYVRVYRRWFFENFFIDQNNIYEFGCGTGFNLLAASKLFPNTNLYGSDFTSSSVELVNQIAKIKNINLKGEVFDMINPNYKYKLKNNSGVFTFGALEQLAGEIDAMLEYLIFCKPKICIHTEPVIELYEKNNLVDYLAIKFQEKRGYTKGLLKKLHFLEKNNRIKILKIKRLYFGSLFMEGYNLVIWRPV